MVNWILKLKQIKEIDIDNEKLENKIVISLERISNTFRVLLWEKAKIYKLSPIQIQIILFLVSHSGDKRNISYLSKEFNLSKPTLSDAIKSLILKGYAEFKQNLDDKRSKEIIITRKGKKIISQIQDYKHPLVEVLLKMDHQEKIELFHSLLKIIEQLVLSENHLVQRMCLSCKFYELINNKIYCNLLKTELLPAELRIDCTDYIQKQKTPFEESSVLREKI